MPYSFLQQVATPTELDYPLPDFLSKYDLEYSKFVRVYYEMANATYDANGNSEQGIAIAYYGITDSDAALRLL